MGLSPQTPPSGRHTLEGGKEGERAKLTLSRHRLPT